MVTSIRRWVRRGVEKCEQSKVSGSNKYQEVGCGDVEKGERWTFNNWSTGDSEETDVPRLGPPQPRTDPAVYVNAPSTHA